MAIKIFTYSNPYDLQNQPYWNAIRKCPTFCASQTQVNGLIGLYDEYQKTTVKTTKYLTEELFGEWEDVFGQISQHAIIDNILNSKIISQLSTSESENITSAFKFNREEVFKSIRTMFELRMDLSSINRSCLTREQKYICEIYGEILSSDAKKRFLIKENIPECEINDAIKAALERNNSDISLPEDLNYGTIVIYSVHQFEPILLRAIEEISAYKNVILLFNYQQQYNNVYQTWINVYSAFEQKIEFFIGTEFQPSDKFTESYQGNLLADQIGRLINGQGSTIFATQKYEILEFDNITEFAGYVSNIYESAVNSGSTVPLSAMREQIYAADSSVNKILKIYYPEQFGEREFLYYPLGHFFLAIANMWDIDTNSIVIRNLVDIKDCFSAEIISEEKHGEILTIFEKSIGLFEGVTTIAEMQKRLKNVRKYKKYLSPENKEKADHVSYIKLSAAECDKLGNALGELSQIAEYFYSDFEKHPGNFANFYKKLHAYLQDEVLDGRELDEAFENIVSRVLERLNQVESIDSTASFECLKSTMNIYLQQEHKIGGSAHWIVRDLPRLMAIF